ncbi:hypothetical protein Q4494_13235 [Celeribacter halophilus]|uniref:Uncharacterized protein n=1 Tax=Celeribacter halophilus TaxID=576117 RepID=A0AAW7XYP5_9RHOB|nr:hypothetical protein [Celeribacter halophilus]MDO6458047.1 hypothetical protein [Celeribacter halophilus]
MRFRFFHLRKSEKRQKRQWKAEHIRIILNSPETKVRHMKQDNPEKLTVLADRDLADALRAEREKIAREQGLKVSLSAVAAMALRRGLEACQ